MLDLPDVSKVSYVEEFLGDQIPDIFNISTAGNGAVVPSQLAMINGWAQMSGYGNESVARMRLGEDRQDSGKHHLNFSVRHHARGSARLVINSEADLHVTVGFVGLDDPANVGGALLYRSESKSWWLQCTKNYHGDPANVTNIDTRWKHKPGVPFVLTISTSPSKVDAYVDGQLIGTCTTNIPTAHGMPWEFQLWNARTATGWSAPALWIDYLAVRQEREPPNNS
jgi:hypothetical protein